MTPGASSAKMKSAMPAGSLRPPLTRALTRACVQASASSTTDFLPVTDQLFADISAQVSTCASSFRATASWWAKAMSVPPATTPWRASWPANASARPHIRLLSRGSTTSLPPRASNTTMMSKPEPP
ncbi:hypothetical protein D9M68_853150 [compost metagenome]